MQSGQPYPTAGTVAGGEEMTINPNDRNSKTASAQILQGRGKKPLTPAKSGPSMPQTIHPADAGVRRGEGLVAVIRVRGTAHVTRKIRETLEMLRLFKVNHLVLVRGDTSQVNMVEKVKDYVTFGVIDEPTLEKLLEKRARLEGNRRLTPEFFKEKKIADYKGLAKIVLASKKKLSEFGIEPVLRLNPPRKGYERQGIKKPFNLGGALGNRGAKISELILRMC